MSPRTSNSKMLHTFKSYQATMDLAYVDRINAGSSS